MHGDRRGWVIDDVSLPLLCPGDRVASWGASHLSVSLLHQGRVWVDPDGSVFATADLIDSERASLTSWLGRHAPYFYEQQLRKGGVLVPTYSDSEVPRTLHMSATDWVAGTPLAVALSATRRL